MTFPCPSQNQRLLKVVLAVGMMFFDVGMMQGAMGFMVPPKRAVPRPLYAGTSIQLSTAYRYYYTEDAFRILQLKPDPGLTEEIIKVAYHLMALKCHPDKVTNKDSTPEERRNASDIFAAINWAYETVVRETSEAQALAEFAPIIDLGYHKSHEQEPCRCSYTTSGSSPWWNDIPEASAFVDYGMPRVQDRGRSSSYSATGDVDTQPWWSGKSNNLKCP